MKKSLKFLCLSSLVLQGAIFAMQHSVNSSGYQELEQCIPNMSRQECIQVLNRLDELPEGIIELLTARIDAIDGGQTHAAGASTSTAPQPTQQNPRWQAPLDAFFSEESLRNADLLRIFSQAHEMIASWTDEEVRAASAYLHATYPFAMRCEYLGIAPLRHTFCNHVRWSMEERQDQLTGRVRRNVRNQAINIPVTLGGVYSGHQQGVSPALDKRWQDLQKAIPTMTHEECNGYLTGPIAKFIPEIVKEALIARANEVSPSPVASGSNNNPSTGFNFPMSANSRQIASSCGICFEGPNAQGVALKGLACCKTNLICKSCLDQCTRGKTNPKCPFCRTANPKQLP